MFVPPPPVRPIADLVLPDGGRATEPLYWLRLDRVGPKPRRVARELRRLDPCLSPGLAHRVLTLAARGVAGGPLYVAGALGAGEAVAAAIRLSRAGARVKVVEPPFA